MSQRLKQKTCGMQSPRDMYAVSFLNLFLRDSLRSSVSLEQLETDLHVKMQRSITLTRTRRKGFVPSVNMEVAAEDLSLVMSVTSLRDPHQQEGCGTESKFPFSHKDRC